MGFTSLVGACAPAVEDIGGTASVVCPLAGHFSVKCNLLSARSPSSINMFGGKVNKASSKDSRLDSSPSPN